MKFVRILHALLGIIPFLWFISFLYVLVKGIFYLGYIPKYGNPVDPYELGLVDWVYDIEVWLTVLSFMSFFLWILITGVIYLFFRDKVAFNKASVILFMVGIGGFLFLNTSSRTCFYG